jgi:autotransporter passenger strand-loop-strand repeat protein
MTDYIEISGQTVSGLVVSNGTVVEVGSGGDLIDTLVRDGGVLVVSSGGVTSTTLVDAGGSQFVAAGGTATETTVQNAGYLAVSSGGTIISAYDSGGSLIVSGGGSEFYTLVADNPSLSITLLVGSGEVSSGLVIGGEISNTSVFGGQQGLIDTLEIASGGVAVSTTILGLGGGAAYVLSGGTAEYTALSGLGGGFGGSLVVSAGGTAAYTVMSLGGHMVVSQGGSATSTSVGYEGQLIVDGGGSATYTMSNPGATVSQTLYVTSGQISSGLIVGSSTPLFVLSGGLTTGTTIVSGGRDVVQYGGTDIGTVVSADGYEVVSGGTSIDTDIIGGLVYAPAGNVSDVTIANSGNLYLDYGQLATGAIVFSGSGTLVIGDDTAPTAVLSGFNSGDTIDDMGLIDGSNPTVEGQTLVIDGSNETLVLQLAGNYAGATFTVAPDSEDVGLYGDHGTLITVSNVPTTVNNVPCFAAGTLITTEHGPVAVGRLSVGDCVLTIEGTLEPILWIGSRAVDCRRHPTPARIMPVRIRAHSLAPGQPSRDLFLSPDHAIFAEGVLIPVKHLLNGGTITQLPVDTVTYYHIELSHHAVILAEGLPVETYRDTGDRNAFANASGVTMLHPSFGPADADTALIAEALGYAPLRVTGPEIERIRSRAQTLAEAPAVPLRHAAV